MTFSDFKDKITTIKTSNLGGLNAQFKLAPKMRLKYNAEKIKARKPKVAAVLALFYPDDHNNMCFLLTQRAHYKGTHSAKISFPGGKIDAVDNSLEETALRETFEEVGIADKKITVLRELTDVYIAPSNFLATPFIAYADEKLVFKKNYEVAKTINVLVSDLLNDKTITTTFINNTYLKNETVPCFLLNNTVVWGATAMILSEIKELLK